MTAQPLWRISVTTSREGEEAVVGLMERLFAQSATVYAPEGRDLSVATVYTSRRADQTRSKRSALQEGLEFLGTCGLDLGKHQIVIQRVPREDWSTSWRKHFKVLEFGRALLIRPSWSKRKAAKGQAVVTLDPGLSFGTGQHATTSFCLRQLVQAAKSGQAQSFLDIGTGSGILAIAAVKLGYRPVKAFDNDPVAVKVAKANAKRNRVADRLLLVRRDLTQVSSKESVQYDFVCANLIQDLLLSQSRRILGRLARGGRLVLAGILATQFDEVQASYEAAGLKLQAVAVEREWKSGLFIRPL